MFNRVSKLSKQTLSNGAAPAGDFDPETLESLLEERESVRHVLASDDGIEYTTEGRTTTFEPDDQNHAYAVVSDRRVFFLLEDSPADPEVTLTLDDVSSVDLREGFLSSTFVLRTAEESIRFDPADEERAETARSFVSRIGDAWESLYDALSGVREANDDVSIALEEGEDPRRDLQRARSRLSRAYYSATRHDDAPTELMEDAIDPVEAELDRLRVWVKLYVADRHLEAARAASGDGEYEIAYEAVGQASETLAEANELLADTDAPDAAERIGDVETALQVMLDALLGDAEDACHQALAASDPSVAVDCWEQALDRYRAALETDLPDEATVEDETLRFQLAWVVGNLIEALDDRASAREAAGDDSPEDVADPYEAAREDLERANRLAEQHPHADIERYAAHLETVEEKVERAQWEWGTAD